MLNITDSAPDFHELESEKADACHEAEDAHLDSDFEARFEIPDHEQEPDAGWPGDLSGMDDLADFNTMEREDYRDE